MGRRSHWERSTVETYRKNWEFEIMLKLYSKAVAKAQNRSESLITTTLVVNYDDLEFRRILFTFFVLNLPFFLGSKCWSL
jgi:hypothetical protein